MKRIMTLQYIDSPTNFPWTTNYKYEIYKIDPIIDFD